MRRLCLRRMARRRSMGIKRSNSSNSSRRNSICISSSTRRCNPLCGGGDSLFDAVMHGCHPTNSPLLDLTFLSRYSFISNPKTTTPITTLIPPSLSPSHSPLPRLSVSLLYLSIYRASSNPSNRLCIVPPPSIAFSYVSFISIFILSLLCFLFSLPPNIRFLFFIYFIYAFYVYRS